MHKIIMADCSYVCIQKWSFRSIKLLLDKGANVNAQDNIGWTVLLRHLKMVIQK